MALIYIKSPKYKNNDAIELIYSSLKNYLRKNFQLEDTKDPVDLIIALTQIFDKYATKIIKTYSEFDQLIDLFLNAVESVENLQRLEILKTISKVVQRADITPDEKIKLFIFLYEQFFPFISSIINIK